MTKPIDPADWLLEHTPRELDEAVRGFANAAMKYQISLGEDSQDQDLSLWMHPDFFTWAVPLILLVSAKVLIGVIPFVPMLSVYLQVTDTQVFPDYLFLY